MELDEVLDEIGSTTADKMVEMFGSYAEDVLEEWLDDEELDDAHRIIDANEERILKDIVEAMGRPLTRNELDELNRETIFITEDECELNGIEIEQPLVDEEGREYELVDEDERQMTLWPEDGPRMKLRRYVA